MLARRGRRAAAGRRARSRGGRCRRGHRAGPWSPVNLARGAVGAAAGRSAVGEHPVGQPVDDDRPDAGRHPAGGRGRRPRTGPAPRRSPGRARTKPPSSGTSSVGAPSVVLRPAPAPPAGRRAGTSQQLPRRCASSAVSVPSARTQRERAGRRRPATSSAAPAPAARQHGAVRGREGLHLVVDQDVGQRGRRPAAAASASPVSGHVAAPVRLAGEPVEQPQLRDRRAARSAAARRRRRCRPPASRNRQPPGGAYRQRMLSPVGSSVTMPVGLLASTMRSVESSVASPREVDVARPGAHARCRRPARPPRRTGPRCGTRPRRRRWWRSARTSGRCCACSARPPRR